MGHLKADLIFYYSKEENEIKLSIDYLDWGNSIFFLDKEIMRKIFHYFMGHKNRWWLYMTLVLFANFVWFCFVFSNAIKISPKNYNNDVFVNRNYVVKNFEVDSFEKYKSTFICCFDDLLDGMYFDTKSCLHYHRWVFFQMQHENSFYKTKKCYSC